MKKRLSIKAIAALTIFTAFATITASAAWIIPVANIDKTKNPITGKTQGAYYAYGNGLLPTESQPNNRPYGITVPRHLYNFAWLQYLGFYNKPSDNGKQFYFELGDNIDMTGWVLPPIGTEENPFIGNFNGNGYVVKGLTISNNFSDYEYHPSDVTSSNFVQPHILGFIGVLGDYNDEFGSTAYSSAANTFKDTGLTGITIKTYVKDTLMGVAAGYAEAKMENVAVDASTITFDSSVTQTTTAYKTFTNISDYYLVGYTPNTKNVTKVDETIYNINTTSGHKFNATEQGEGATGWGGSIDMMSVTKRLQTIRDSYATKASNTNPYYYSYTNVYHDGVLDDSASSSLRDTSNYTYLYNSNEEAGHFNFIRESQSEGERYALMGGGHYESNTYYTSYNHSGSYITDGTNYLSVDEYGYYNTTNSSDASLWSIPETSGKIYTSWNGEQYYLRNESGLLTLTTSESSGTNWTITTNGATMLIVNGNYKLAYYNGSWMLISSEGTTYYTLRNGTNYFGPRDSYQEVSTVNSGNATKWMVDGNGYYYYVEDDVTYYLGRYYSYTYNSRWRTYTVNDSAEVCALAPDEMDEFFTYYTFDGNYFSTTGKVVSGGGGWGGGSLTTSTFYIRYDSGWTSTTSTTNRTQITRTTGHDTISNYNSITLNNTLNDVVERTGPDEYVSKSEEGMNYKGNDVTYFPLSTVNNTNNFAPSDNNTAYVVGGSSTKSTTTSYGSTLTNVRFGYYPISGKISNDYSNSSGNFSHVYTINDSGGMDDIVNSTAYEKLADAKTNLGGIMKGQTNVYGLHFMEATISMNALTTATYVKVNKQTHSNYELPVNSIDFHLKEFGYINFMAGSYYYNSNSDRNNSFFALYQIERLDSAPNKINRILEVLNIYKHSSGNKSYSYVYQLKDTVTGNIFYTKPYKVIDANGNKEWLYDTTTDYSNNQYVSSLPANYSLVFKVDRIKKNTVNNHNAFDYHVFYFEIPMNDGEFCLGSVEGAVGCYLMYLDIGANASEYHRTIFYEHFNVATKTYAHPEGVALKSLPTTIVSETSYIPTEFDDGDSACVKISAGYKNSLTVDRTDADVAITNSSDNAPPIYAGEEITLVHATGSSTPLTIQAVTSVTKDIRRMTYYDYNVTLQTVMTTQITDVSTDGGSTYTRASIVQKIYSTNTATGTPTTVYTYDPNASTPIDQRSSMKVYNTSNGVKFTDANLISTTTLAIDTSKISSTEVLTVRLLQPDGSFTEDIVIVADISTNAQNLKIYTFQQYTITITPTGAAVTVKVINNTNGLTIYYGTTPAPATGQTITIPVPANP